MRNHGGELLAAEKKIGVYPEKWIDLSTGINPNPWPVDGAKVTGWERLPETPGTLESVAKDFYNAESLLVTAGSMAAIRAIPRLFKPVTVGMITPSFYEHFHAWHRAGHDVTELLGEELLRSADIFDVVVIVNPNNPTGHRFDRADLLLAHKKLKQKGGLLVVDEAFIDATEAESVASETGGEGLLVLRSLGKFYGLAGIRVGFAMGDKNMIGKLEEELGLWPVAGSSRSVAEAALKDNRWRKEIIIRLHESSERLRVLLARHGFSYSGGTDFFAWVITDDAEVIHDRLARLGILIRLIKHPVKSLRFGLPRNEKEWLRLDNALQGVMK